ncbi:hypothetical protein GCM10010464_29390 [Pseudonocardia yunnanensis]
MACGDQSERGQCGQDAPTGGSGRALAAARAGRAGRAGGRAGGAEDCTNTPAAASAPGTVCVSRRWSRRPRRSPTGPGFQPEVLPVYNNPAPACPSGPPVTNVLAEYI